MGMSAHAELLKNLKWDGSLETRSFSIDNETDLDSSTDDHRGETRTRVMVGANFDLLDDVHSRILLRKNNRVHGAAGGTSENGDTVQTAIRVDNAYVKIDKVMDRGDLTIGRQFYGDPNDLVIYFGPNNDDVLSVNALDTFRADADLGGWAKAQGLAGKRSDTGAVGTNSDTDLYGGLVTTDKVLPKGGLGLAYWVQRVKGAGVTGNNNVEVMDIFAKGDVLDTGLRYHAQFAQNFGRDYSTAGNPANDGNMLFLGLNYGRNMNDMPFRAMVEWGRGTNDWTPVAAGKRFGIIWGQHSTSGISTLNGVGGAGLTNLQVADIGLGVNVTPKLGVDFNAYKFWYDDATTSSNGTDDDAGTEFDLIVSWKHSDNVAFEVNAASFQVGDGLANTGGTPTSPITRLGADVKIKF
jgi:hypothetical protein